jgi:hypothetical protein
MNEQCRSIPNPCEEKVVDAPPRSNSPFSVCFGTNTLHYDGRNLTLERGVSIPDGTYTAVVVRNGCIVEGSQAPVPEYTPPPCVEPPSPCDGSGTDVVVSPLAGNLTRLMPSGLFTQDNIIGAGGVSVTGTGTPGDPKVISVTPGAGPTITPANAHISVTNPAPNVIGIGMNPTGFSAGTYNGLIVDSYGIVTGYSPSTGGTITGVAGANEVDAIPSGSIVTVTLKPTAAGAATYVMGGYTMSFSQGGVLTTATRNINIPAGTYVLGGYNVNLNAYGSVDGIVRTITLTPGSFTTADGKTVQYDAYGTITSVT